MAARATAETAAINHGNWNGIDSTGISVMGRQSERATRVQFVDYILCGGMSVREPEQE